MFSVGAKIVHPMHGAGTIQKIEEKEILGVVKRYYILKLPCNDMSVMIPVDAEASVGIREIVDESVIENAVRVLRQESTKMDKNWNRRYRENMEKLKTGDILAVAEVVRNLMRVNREKKPVVRRSKDARQCQADTHKRDHTVMSYHSERSGEAGRRRRLNHWALKALTQVLSFLKKGGK